MSVSRWAYIPERCDGDVCVGDCDLCSKAQDNIALMEEDNDVMDDLIRRADARTELVLAARRYTVAHEAHGYGRVVWSDNLISVSDAVDVLRKLPSAQPDLDEWCTDCKEYDHDKHCCPRFNRVIRTAMTDSNTHNTLEALEALDERKHGEWIVHENQRQEDVDNGNYLYVCSECGKSDIHAKTQKVPFCWWCGARMDGDENG